MDERERERCGREKRKWVYAENRPAKHYVSNVGSIPIIYDGLNQNHISTGTGTSPVVEPILTLEDA
ncbi:unnamed protein product [Prunus armeniaca]